MDYDPFFPAIGPAFTAAFLDYLHHELKFGRDEDLRRLGLRREVGLEAQAAGLAQLSGAPAPNTVPDLARAMTMNPGLHVLVQQGCYDLATPALVTKHDLEHLRIDARGARAHPRRVSTRRGT